MKQLPFLMISSTPSMKYIAQISSQIKFMAKSTYIHHFMYVFLTTSHVPQVWHRFLHDNTFWGKAWDLCWELGRAKSYT